MRSSGRRLLRATKSVLGRSVRARIVAIVFLLSSLLAQAGGLAYKLGLVSIRAPDILVVVATVLASTTNNPLVIAASIILGIAVLSFSYAKSYRHALVLATVYALPFIFTSGVNLLLTRVGQIILLDKSTWGTYTFVVLVSVIAIMLIIIVDRYLSAVWHASYTIVRPGMARPFITSIVILILMDNIYSRIMDSYKSLELNITALVTVLLAIIGLVSDEKKQTLYYSILLFAAYILGSVMYFAYHNPFISSLLLILGLSIIVERLVIPRLKTRPRVALTLDTILLLLAWLLALPSLIILVNGYAFLDNRHFVTMTFEEKLYILGGVPGVIASIITLILGITLIYWILFRHIKPKQFSDKLIIVYFPLISITVLAVIFATLDSCATLIYSKHPHYATPIALIVFVILIVIQDLLDTFYNKLAKYLSNGAAGISSFYLRVIGIKPPREATLSMLVTLSLILYFFYEAPAFYSYMYAYDHRAVSQLDLILHRADNDMGVVFLIIIIYKIWYFSETLDTKPTLEITINRFRLMKNLRKFIAPLLLTLLWLSLTVYTPTLYTTLSDTVRGSLGLPKPITRAECLGGDLLIEVRDPSLAWTHIEPVVFKRIGDFYSPVGVDSGKVLILEPGEVVEAYTPSGNRIIGVIHGDKTLTLPVPEKDVNETFIIVYLSAMSEPSPCLAIEDSILRIDDTLHWETGSPRLVILVPSDYIPAGANAIIVAYRDGLGQPSFVKVEIHDIVSECKNS